MRYADRDGSLLKPVRESRLNAGRVTAEGACELAN
jgi:hypothetical protein